MMGISKAEFARRRKTLMGMMEPNSIAIVPTARPKTRSRDTEYPFRPDSNFWYLTGFTEPEAVLVLLPGRSHGEFVLFCRERNPEKEIWDGVRAGPEGVIDSLGADDAFPIDDIDDILPGLIEGRDRVYYAMGRDALFDRRVMNWVNRIRENIGQGAVPPGEFLDLDHLLHDMRLYKSAAEIRLIRTACEISADAHLRAMAACTPGMMEYQLEAELVYEFTRRGARAPAYPSIVGGGDNACILHYIDNNSSLRSGDLVLIDAGCEYQGYAADITRTFPVSGAFSPPQRALYELVLAVQEAAIATLKPGGHWNQAHEVSVRVMTEGLVALGLLEGEPAALIESGAYKAFYMHRIGHWLGMDVHDVGDYRVGDQWRVLEPGMVLTVEPGLYISPQDERVAKKWRGLAIRIEDDVLITRDGCEILSGGVPKTCDAIEAHMARARNRKKGTAQESLW